MKDGISTLASTFGPRATMDRLEAAVRAKGLTVFARIDHAAGAVDAGLALRPTELLIFGTARSGTLLMQHNQLVGIDLPLKALVWQDAARATWLTYNDPHWIVARHGEGHIEPVTSEIASALVALAQVATGSP